MKEVIIVDQTGGNVGSLFKAFKRLKINVKCSTDPIDLLHADHIVIPGVGHFGKAMQRINDLNLLEPLEEAVVIKKTPVLGICLGMQLMCSFSEENDTPCLGIFKETVKHFPKNSYKVPQIGWNNIYDLSNTLFSGIAENSYVYFIHGFYVEVSKYTIAKANYILEYSAALHKNNFYAVQFHPEKSGKIGQKILENFLFQV